MSQLRENVQHIFDCFCEVSIPSASDQLKGISSNIKPHIIQKFPDSFQEEDVLRLLPDFACPCPIGSSVVEHFSFVLLRKLEWVFGFCRCSPADGSALILLSALPWHDLMYKLLNTFHLVLEDGGTSQLLDCLRAVDRTPVPADGDTLHVKLPDGTEFSADCPDRHRLPALLVDRNLTEYWSVVDDHAKLEVFAALLHERHVLVTSSRLGRLSACVQAAQAMLYPLWWQRLFMPVVPDALSGCLESPVAYLAGCPASVVARLGPTGLADGCVVLDADHSRVTTPHRDLQKLPADLVSTLRRQLKQVGPGDGVSRAFQTAVLQLVGDYRHGIRYPQDGRPTFDEKAFLQSQPSSRRPFLRILIRTQMFEQFIDERLSCPSSLGDTLVRQPSTVSVRGPLPPRLWLQSLVGHRRLFSAGPQSAPVAAPGYTGQLTCRFRSTSLSTRVELDPPPTETRSAPGSPASRWRWTGASAPSLLLTGQPRVASTDRDHRADKAAQSPGDRLDSPLEDPTLGDPLDDFSPSIGCSLIDEINTELMKRGEICLGDALSPARQQPQTRDEVASGGDEVSDDVFRGAATEAPLRRRQTREEVASGGDSASDDVFRGAATEVPLRRRQSTTANGLPPRQPSAGSRAGQRRTTGSRPR